MKEDFHKQILDFMDILTRKGLNQVPVEKLKHGIAEVFGDDRHRVSFILKHLIEIGFVKVDRNNIARIDSSVEEKYRLDRLFFM
ncbi:MAG: hypothetical protein WC821_01130 [archaeon]|jgi:hypothetical protein